MKHTAEANGTTYEVLGQADLDAAARYCALRGYDKPSPERTAVRLAFLQGWHEARGPRPEADE